MNIIDERIGRNLKRLRKERDLSVPTVVELLQERGFEIKVKTFYAYEAGSSVPNADLFLSLCDIYQVTNVMREFEYGDTIMPNISSALLFCIPLINDVYDYAINHKYDVLPLLNFISDDNNKAILGQFIAGKGLALPLKRILEETCKMDLEKLHLYTGKTLQDYQPYTLSREEIAAALSYRQQIHNLSASSPASSTNQAG